MLVAIGVCRWLGILIERLAYTAVAQKLEAERPHHRHRRFAAARERQRNWFSAATPRPFPGFSRPKVCIFSAARAFEQQLAVLVISIILLVALAMRFIVLRTRIGTAMRAVSFNPSPPR